MPNPFGMFSIYTVLRAFEMKFLGNNKGNTLVLFALSLPVVLLMAGVPINYGLQLNTKTQLQAAVDAAAIASAKELTVVGMDDIELQVAAQKIFEANLGKAAAGTKLVTKVIKDPLTVEITAVKSMEDLFVPSLFGGGTTELQARAVAGAVGNTPICVIGLHDSAERTVALDSNSRLTAPTCAVYSNSDDSKGLSSLSNSVLNAGLICSAGGKEGSKSNFEPSPLTDCPTVENPLAGRPAPTVGACSEINLEIKDKTASLDPGVYCGGLRIDGNAKVHFRPGVYVIKDGMFNVDSNSEIDGEYVGFYLTGKDATFRFASNAKVDLSAPKDGPLAGLLFYEDENAPDLRRHEILSNYAHILVGTVYLPKGRLVVDADNDVADQSAYTAIVARRIELFSGPNLVLNTDYQLTDVPVPSGISSGNRVALLE